MEDYLESSDVYSNLLNFAAVMIHKQIFKKMAEMAEGKSLLEFKTSEITVAYACSTDYNVLNLSSDEAKIEFLFYEHEGDVFITNRLFSGDVKERTRIVKVFLEYCDSYKAQEIA